MGDLDADGARDTLLDRDAERDRDGVDDARETLRDGDGVGDEREALRVSEDDGDARKALRDGEGDDDLDADGTGKQASVSLRTRWLPKSMT